MVTWGLRITKGAIFELCNWKGREGTIVPFLQRFGNLNFTYYSNIGYGSLYTQEPYRYHTIYTQALIYTTAMPQFKGNRQRIGMIGWKGLLIKFVKYGTLSFYKEKTEKYNINKKKERKK